jgi:hypothetical protein
MKRLLPVICVLLCLVGLAVAAAAQVPPTISYQGVLTNAAGTPVSDGVYSITFRIYDSPLGDPVPWSEVRDVDVHKGIFNVILGEVNPLNLAFDRPYWLGISVSGGAELEPRMPLTSSPYSLNAREVNGHENIFPSSGFVGIGTKAPSVPLQVVTGSITGLRVDGMADGAWASIVLNAQGANSAPSLEYYREGGYKARTYVNELDSWKLELGMAEVITALYGSGNVGVGVGNPLERLDVAGAVRLGTTASSNAGTIRWTGSDFEGYDGASWKSFTSGGGGGLPSGSSGQTLRHDGSSWVASDNIYNDGTNVGIGTTNPQFKLHVNGLARFDLPTGQVNMSTPGGWPGIIAYSPSGLRRDIVYDNESMWLAASNSSAAPPADKGLVLENGGNIGIGTYDPAEKLHVVGTSRFDVGSGQVYVHDMTDSPNITGFADNGHRRDIVFDDYGIYIFTSPDENVGGASRGIAIDEEGNVGVGAGSHPPEYGLSVNRGATGTTVAIGGTIGAVTIPLVLDVSLVGRYESASGTGVGVYGETNTTSSTAVGVYGAALGAGFGVVSDGDFITFNGTKSALVKTADYGNRKLYCLEAAGNYFEDFGQGQLVNGEATISIDPVFAQTVNLGTTYHVFLTPMGDCGLYVSAKTPTSFTVRAIDGKQVNLTFDYRIVAKRLGYEGKRLEPAQVPTIATRR